MSGFWRLLSARCHRDAERQERTLDTLSLFLKGAGLIVYRPNERFEQTFFRALFSTLQSVVREKELIFYRVRKELLGRYKRSFLGSFWVILSPLAGIVSWIILHYGKILAPGKTDIPYPAYVLSGTLLWTLFMRTTTSISQVLMSSRYVLTHVRFPHEILPVIHGMVALIQFGISLLISLPVLAAFGIFPSFQLLLLPLAIVPLLVLASAIGLVASVLSAISYDLSRVVTATVGFVMFITPVVYSREGTGNSTLSSIVAYNPLTYLLALPRSLLVPTEMPPLAPFLVSALCSLALLLFCWRAFYLTEHRLIERLI